MTTEYNPGLFEYLGKVSPKEYFPLGAQHMIVAIVNAVTPALIVANVAGLDARDTAMLVQVCLLFTALATLTQLYTLGGRIGGRLPAMTGTSLAYVPTMTAIVGLYGLPALLGAQIVGGIVAMLVGVFFKPMRKLFPPVVTGTVIFSIGVSLYPVGIRNIAGGAGAIGFGNPENWIVAIIAIAMVIFFTHFTKGIPKLASVLLGVIAGYIAAIFFGIVSFESIGQIRILPTIPGPLHFGIEFVPGAIISLSIMSIINCVQMIGDVSSITYGGMDRAPTTNEYSGTILAQGFFSVLGGIFGPLPLATYSQNVGLITLNRVVNRRVFVCAALIMLMAGLFPIASSILATIPLPVLGGATLLAFATIVINGIRMINDAGINPRNITIFALSVALGIGIVQVPGSLSGFPDWVSVVFASNAVVVSALLAIILNLILPKDKEDA